MAIPCSLCDGLCEDNKLACLGCRARYGDVLVKAMQDPFSYAAGLRSGAVVEFTLAVRVGEWLFLERDGHEDTPVSGLMCPRGVQVRLADIVWIADAPSGS